MAAEPIEPKPMNRRKWITRAAIGSVVFGAVYPFLEAKWCRVTRKTVTLPNLWKPLEGTTIAFLSDVHHGPFVPRAYVRSIVSMTNALKPDLILLGGDYTHSGTQYVAPVHEDLGELKAPMGRFAVLGNHDHWDGYKESVEGLEAAGITLLRNSGAWVEKGFARLKIAGVGDLWCDKVDVSRALGDATKDDAVILLSHNPDVAETLRDDRVGLMLSGHTHGGQVVVPFYGAPRVPSKYGQKYLRGLIQGPACDVFVSRGVGTISPPVRLFCRPEIVLLTLTARSNA